LLFLFIGHVQVVDIVKKNSLSMAFLLSLKKSKIKTVLLFFVD